MKSAKRWGNTEVLIDTPFCEVHRIFVRKGGMCSRHKHEYKNNAFYVEQGELTVHMQDGDEWAGVTLGRGEMLNVPPNIEHQFQAQTDVIAFEYYWPDGCKPDIVRKPTLNLTSPHTDAKCGRVDHNYEPSVPIRRGLKDSETF